MISLGLQAPLSRLQMTLVPRPFLMFNFLAESAPQNATAKQAPLLPSMRLANSFASAGPSIKSNMNAPLRQRSRIVHCDCQNVTIDKRRKDVASLLSLLVNL